MHSNEDYMNAALFQVEVLFQWRNQDMSAFQNYLYWFIAEAVSGGPFWNSWFTTDYLCS